MTYQAEYQRSVDDPEGFWLEKAAALDWYRDPVTALGRDENGIERWFPDGELNTCHLALDAHLAAGNGERVALYYDSPVTGTREAISYAALHERVARFAGALQALGVSRGDRVLIYMPMVPEAVVGMLACARLGAIHSVVFGGFAAHELAIRIDDATPRVVLAASCGIEVDRVIEYKPLLDRALASAGHQPEATVLFQREQARGELQSGRDHDWLELERRAQPVPCVPVAATDPLYILYTSGTTGKPKGVVRDNGGHAVAMHYSMQAVYNMQPGEVFWAASDVGWVVGHSYIVYAPLIAGVTSVLYEGKPVRTPDAGAFWRVVSDYRVKALFAAPTAFRAIRKEDPDSRYLADYDISSLETVFMAGERLDPPTYDWASQLLGVPVVDHWWQTETGWAICCNPMGIEPMPTRAGSSTFPTPGYNVRILGEDGRELGANEQGIVALRRPLPPGCLPTIWGNFPRFRDGYLASFEGYYVSGDGGYRDEDGYIYIMGRTDDVINVAGHRLSTGEMEEVLAAHPAVAECAVIGVHCELKGQKPLGLILLKDGASVDEAQLEAELVARVRDEVGAVASFKEARVVTRLPKTRSGKILRKVLRQIADGEDFSVPSTIDDPASLEEAARVLRGSGG